MSLFSIIVPVYNVESWLARCLDSILSDQCTDMEIILVDDGSTDDSGIICDHYAASHTCISVVHKENGGLSSARNAGLERASGEWISFIDSDDWVDQDTYHSMAALLAQLGEAKPDMVKFGYKRVVGDKVEACAPCVPEGTYNHDEIVRELLPAAFGSKRISNSTIHTFILSAWSHLYRREFLEKTGLWFVSEREIASEDFLYVNSLYMRASSVYVSHATRYNYELREGSLSARYRKELFEQYKYLGTLIQQELETTNLYALLQDDFSVFYVGLMYTCVINECTGPGGHLSQVGRVRRIIRDDKLKNCLRGIRLSDQKSRLLAGLMRTGMALPLCANQWRKAT